ncbi:MAG: hypothetical protein J6R67_03160 [Treponema sp.]|nr:hypothetical protein [Treponema sp.]
MLSLYALIAVFAIFVISIIFTLATKNSKGLEAVIISAVFLLFTFYVVAIANSSVNDRISAMHDTYDNLMLYHETVEASTNEYVRFDYHEKVEEYNAAYDFNLAESEGAVFGWLYLDGWDSGLDYIDFQLHGDE